MRVNGIRRDAAQEHLDHAFALWRQRSKQSWKIDYGEYEALIGTGDSHGGAAEPQPFNDDPPRGRC